MEKFTFAAIYMANSYFKFKQFTVFQEKTAMRVCTDACVFGAVVAAEIDTKNVLDIGAGTGLLSLMYIQKHPHSNIDAVELEENAFQQSKENFEESPWKDHLHIYHTAIQYFRSEKKYDLIISNPPFFENDLKSKDAHRNLAMHSESLTLQELLTFAMQHLNEDGKFALLIPFHRTEYVKTLAKEKGLNIRLKLLVKQTEMHSYFRTIFIFQKEETIANTRELYIKNAQNQYGTDFAHYLKDYYLFL